CLWLDNKIKRFYTLFMKIHVCQIQPKLGDVAYNLSSALTAIKTNDFDVILFPELFLTGYPPRDYLSKPDCKDSVLAAIDQLKAQSKSKHYLIVIGTPYYIEELCYNAAVCICDGEIIATHYKNCLPNYDVFNDSRYFSKGQHVAPFKWHNKTFAILICEDIWADQFYYDTDPVLSFEPNELDMVFHLTASPFEVDKLNKRVEQLRRLAKQTLATVISVNQVGAYTDLLFDGQSMVLNKQGKVITKWPSFKEVSECINLSEAKDSDAETSELMLLNALAYGLREYMRKSGFEKVIIGLSGGIDSALTAAIATKAIGSENVLGVSMPTKYNAKETKQDAFELSKRLSCQFIEHPIDDLRLALNESIISANNGHELNDICSQNIQARLRGVVLMALSNQHNALVLTTGNKSELAMGYSTLYGDMCGGLNLIGDLFKTDVFELSQFIANTYNLIPQSIIDRPPSAELAPNQRDEDTLPPYKELDQILKQIMIENHPLNTIYELNDNNNVNFIVKRLAQNEFKRVQSPPIIKVSSNAFGRGWQYPIVL
ncbi:MAG: NAD+ synthase, partial [Candidatus Margulisiibacteriota bacterium]|nr:NAD+ synthase [Candidatus Margulisiibacteriota bacterium]